MLSRRLRTILVIAAVLLAVAAVYVTVALVLRNRVIAFGQDGEDIASQLLKLGKAMEKHDQAAISEAYSADFETSDLYGWARAEAGQIDEIQRYSWTGSGARPGNREQQVAAIMSALKEYEQIEQSRVKLLRFTDGMFDARRKVALCRFWINGRHAKLGRINDRGTFQMTFVRERDGWKIARQTLDRGESVASHAPAAFRDVTQDAGLRTPAAAADAPEDNRAYWDDRRNGLAAGDVDNNGWPDIIVPAPDGSALLLFLNFKGRFTDATAASGLTPARTEHARSLLLFDFDNDGRLDLFVGRGVRPNQLYRNVGNGRFEDVTAGSGLEQSGVVTAMACAGDYDGDGLLDLYLGNAYHTRRLPENPFLADNLPPDQLYHNLGNGRFEDVSVKAGVAHTGDTLACGFFDANDDGSPDLFVANDFGINHLYINQKNGTFRESGADAGLYDIGNYMSFDVADTRARGILDLYATKIDSNAQWYWGEILDLQLQANLLNPFVVRRVLRLRRVLARSLAGVADAPPDARVQTRLKLSGNCMYVWQGPQKYERMDVGASNAQWAWAGVFGDYDNDGWPDLYVANGWISNKIPDDV